MVLKMKNNLEQELANYLKYLNKAYSLDKISPLLFRSIKEFTLREGKRIRPILFIMGYKGFAKKEASGLYTSALSIELLHDFMLVHDDIIDKSDTRRGKPSMHKIFNNHLKKYKNIKFKGEDLGIVAGDIIYALAIRSFLSIKVEEKRKEQALRKLMEAAIYTGSGEFLELLYGIKGIESITKPDIYKVYGLKTAIYTFATPLAAGAILGGAQNSQVERLFKYGLYLGRAFQIKDDIIGIFADEKKIGKPSLVDLKEAKKTILIWYAYRHSDKKDKLTIKNIFSKTKVGKKDLLKIRKIMIQSGSLEFARKEVENLIKKAQNLLLYSQMSTPHKVRLWAYSKDLLNL